METLWQDLKYGARHLKRAIERLLVQPMSNLIATDQVRGGDCILVDFNADGVPDFVGGAEDGHLYYLRNPKAK